jgi:uncharacterized protein (DUF1800 family)
MATFDAQKTSWTADDVQHFARRAGFGTGPEKAAQLAAQSPGAVVTAWVEGTASMAAFDAALPIADVVDLPGYGSSPDEWAPHPFHLSVQDPGYIATGQAYWAWRMQYSPNPFREKLALFWHNFFATGLKKVEVLPLMLKQIDLFRRQGTGAFGDLLLGVSQDAAMMIWLDTVQNKVERAADVPNENYAREVLELYSLGIDNGYTQKDITELAKALTGWDYIGRDFPDAENPYYYNDAEFIIYRGQANPYPNHPWLRGYSNLPNQRMSGTFTLFGVTLDLGAGSHYGADAIQLILSQRGANCAEFLAKRLLLGFVTPEPTAAALQDLKNLILANQFRMGDVFKALFNSAYFYSPEHRFALIEGPAAWTVRAAKAVMPDFAAALAARAGDPTGLPRFSAWFDFVGWDASGFFAMGQNLLDPKGPNGWKEHAGWLNADTYRHRTRSAWAVAGREDRGDDHTGRQRFLFDSDWRTWFPAAPASPVAVFDRLVALLQPAPVPAVLRDAWLARLFSGPFAWDTSAATGEKVRRLAFLILCSPQAMQH